MDSGTYNYFLNGQPTGVVESFKIRTLPNGSKFTISTRNAKSFNTTITVKVIEKHSVFQRVEMRYVNEKRIHSIYKFLENEFLFVHENFQGKTTSETINFPNNYVFFPLMRCFQGQTILQVAANQDFTTVIVPDIQPSTDIKNFLKPTFDERTAKLISERDNLRIFKYLSKNYDDNSEFHLDENGLLVYYKFVQSETQIWEVRL